MRNKRPTSTAIQDLEIGDTVIMNLTGDPEIVVVNVEYLGTRHDPYRITWSDDREPTRHGANARFRVK